MQIRFATGLQLQRSKVGFPIRKFSDQSSFAAPRNLSQRTTSFIASQRQGILRIPLRHLIALIIDAHLSASLGRRRGGRRFDPARLDRKTSFASNIPRDIAVKLCPRLVHKTKITPRIVWIYFLFTMLDNPLSSRSRKRNFIWTNRKGGVDRDRNIWWSQTGSNRRPHACKARALPTELWPLEMTQVRANVLVGLGGLEPPTSRLSSARSNQLSYKPKHDAISAKHETVPKPSDEGRARPGRKRNVGGGCPALIGLTGHLFQVIR